MSIEEKRCNDCGHLACACNMQKSYKDYLQSREPFDEPTLSYDQFVESMTAD